MYLEVRKLLPEQFRVACVELFWYCQQNTEVLHYAQDGGWEAAS